MFETLLALIDDTCQPAKFAFCVYIAGVCMVLRHPASSLPRQSAVRAGMSGECKTVFHACANPSHVACMCYLDACSPRTIVNSSHLKVQPSGRQGTLR